MAVKADDHFDLIIAGGGLSGSLLANAPGLGGRRVALIDNAASDPLSPAGFDDRVIALSLGSQQILQEWGLWSDLREQAEAIARIHVSELGRYGFLRLCAAEQMVPAFGFVVTARALGQAFWQGDAAALVTRIHPATCALQQQTAESVRVRVTDPDGQSREMTCSLLVVADGGASGLAAAAGIGFGFRSDYRQSAIIANLQTDLAHHGCAYERFTDSGPTALLPMTEGRYSLVWTADHDEVEGLLALSDTDFIERLQRRIGFRQGRIRRLGRRSAYPLAARIAERYTLGRLALLGNAAHRIHPVAGQGFNLGVRDAAVLSDLLEGAGDVGDASLLDAYQRARSGDLRRTLRWTDGLLRSFCNPFPGLPAARNLGLLAMDRALPAKRAFARVFMGLTR
jgi:2-octaprenyl-6-methoxyphenol hydroxylase